jgi:hypothetical protein
MHFFSSPLTEFAAKPAIVQALFAEWALCRSRVKKRCNIEVIFSATAFLDRKNADLQQFSVS